MIISPRQSQQHDICVAALGIRTVPSASVSLPCARSACLVRALHCDATRRDATQHQHERAEERTRSERKEQELQQEQLLTHQCHCFLRAIVLKRRLVLVAA
eukprot:2999711-Pleurochrysis_carterae.AAC.1